MRRLLPPAVVAVLAAAALAGCTGNSDFEAGAQVGDVERALRAEGLRTCSNTPADYVPADAATARTLVVAPRCPAEPDDTTVLRIVEWEDEEARDLAVQRHETSRSRHGAVGASAWTFGPLSITVAGEHGEWERVAQALDSLEVGG